MGFVVATEVALAPLWTTEVVTTKKTPVSRSYLPNSHLATLNRETTDAKGELKRRAKREHDH